MSLIDDIRKALQGISPQDAMKGNFRSCAACSYFKNGFCTQTQPPAQILNVYEAQICIYYTPPTVTKETQPISSLDTVKALINIVMGEIFALNLLKNADFESGSFPPWVAGGLASIDAVQKFQGTYSAKLIYSTPIFTAITQHVPFLKGCDLSFLFAYRTDVAATVRLTLFYETQEHVFGSETYDFSTLAGGEWDVYGYKPITSERIYAIQLKNITAGSTIWVDNVFLIYDPSNVREDLLTKSWDLTVGTTQLLEATTNRRHKIYGWDYEVDIDGATEFSATINGTASTKFARRITKGVHTMPLVHPIVCDVDTALLFISAGNTKLSLRYKTEF